MNHHSPLCSANFRPSVQALWGRVNAQGLAVVLTVIPVVSPAEWSMNSFRQPWIESTSNLNCQKLQLSRCLSVDQPG
jgi:hypothetical protein